MKLTDLLNNRKKYKAKILAMPKKEATKYIHIIKILLLTDRQIIDALIATYFTHHTGTNPIKTPHRLPITFIKNFKTDKEFFYYISDLLKERI